MGSGSAGNRGSHQEGEISAALARDPLGVIEAMRNAAARSSSDTAGFRRPTLAETEAVVAAASDSIDAQFWRFLVGMGFPPARALRALMHSRMRGQEALDWLLRTSAESSVAVDGLPTPEEVRAAMNGGPGAGAGDAESTRGTVGGNSGTSGPIGSAPANQNLQSRQPALIPGASVSSSLNPATSAAATTATFTSSSSSSSSSSTSSSFSLPSPAPSGGPSNVSEADLLRTRALVDSVMAAPSMREALTVPTMVAALQFIVDNHSNPAITPLMEDESVARVLVDLENAIRAHNAHL